MAEIPEGWVRAKLADISEPISSTDPSALDRRTFRYVDIGSINNRTNEIVEPQILATHEAPSRARRIIKSDDVLFSTVRTYLKNIAMVDRNLDGEITSTGIAVIRSNGAFVPRYIFHLLRSDDFIRGISEKQDGTLYPAITDKDLFATSIALPPLAEQERIVSKIDTLLANVARARVELARVPVLVEKFKAGLLRYTTQDSDLYQSSEWKIYTVNDVCETTFDGPFGSNLKSRDYVEKGVRVVRLENIGSLRFIAEKETYIDEEKFLSLQRHELKEGDVLFSSFLADSVRVCQLPGNLPTKSINKADCFCLRVDKLVCNPKFLAYRLASQDTYQTLIKGVHGATRPRISLSQLKKFSLRLPPIRIQDKIVAMLDKAFDHLDNVDAQYRSIVSLLDRMEQQILAKAFLGELVPQDPNDEPASTLLERVKAERDSGKKTKPTGYPVINTATAKAARAKVRSPRAPRTTAMPKARTDEDVWHQPYLAQLLRIEVLIDEVDLSVELGIEDTGPRAPEAVAQALFKRSDLEIADFYKQLAWEIEAGHILEESDGRLRAA